MTYNTTTTIHREMRERERQKYLYEMQKLARNVDSEVLLKFSKVSKETMSDGVYAKPRLS